MQPVSKSEAENNPNLKITSLEKTHEMPRFRTAYGPKQKVQIIFSTEGRTKQSFKDECDINTIMKRYLTTGVLPDLVNDRSPQYFDCTGFEYQEAMERVAEAHTLFERLPSAVRDRFKNDPGEFLEFAENPDNRQELIDMGLGSVPPDLSTPPSSDPPPKAEKPVKAPAKGIKPEDQLPLAGVEDSK